MMTHSQDPLRDVRLNVTVELARTRMSLDEALALGQGSVVELDRLAGEPVSVQLNGKLFARGEVVGVAGNYGVRLTEIMTDLDSGADAESGDGHD
jgi:flagellar motor switch protein FliN